MGILRSTADLLIPRTPWGDALFSAGQSLVRYRRLPAWREPRTFSDHLFAMKLSGELYDPVRQFITDKVYMKRYVSRVVGADYVLAPLAVLTSEPEIDAFDAPGPCVVKPTHLSGRHMIVADEVDKAALKQWLRLSYYHEAREPNYRYLRPRILVEELYADGPVREFKVYCVRGKPQFINAILGDGRRVYSTDWEDLPFWELRPPSGFVPPPACGEEILEVARKLARPFNFIRVDFLVARGRPKVCELTNLSNNGIVPITPPEYNVKLGALFDGADLRDLENAPRSGSAGSFAHALRP